MRHSIPYTLRSSTAASTLSLVDLSYENILSCTTSSKPYLSQSVTPVTPSLAEESSVCAQPYVTYTPFVAQGMTTLFSR